MEILTMNIPAENHTNRFQNKSFTSYDIYFHILLYMWLHTFTFNDFYFLLSVLTCLASDLFMQEHQREKEFLQLNWGKIKLTLVHVCISVCKTVGGCLLLFSCSLSVQISMHPN